MREHTVQNNPTKAGRKLETRNTATLSPYIINVSRTHTHTVILTITPSRLLKPFSFATLLYQHQYTVTCQADGH